MQQMKSRIKLAGWVLGLALVAPVTVTPLLPAGVSLASAWAAPTAETVVTSETAAQNLRRHLDAMQGLQGQFTQTLTDAEGELLDESSGEFKLARPGKFYWHTQAPMTQLLISDGATIWLYDPDLETVNQRPFSDDLRQTPALLLSEDASNLSKNFAISQRTVNASTEAFTLVPHETEGLFAKLTLVFKGAELVEFVIEDTMGQVTRCRLSQVQRNPSFTPNTFNFLIPEGAEVIQN